VGRSGPLALLRQAYARAQTGQIQLVVLEGEAGIGKTRLATEFLAWAEAQGADMLIGRGFKAEVCLPYASLVAGLRARLERENAPDDLLSDLWLAELARLLPELRERYPDLAAVTEDVTLGQGRLYEAVAQLGQALAARRPLVLFLDDAQWMHAATRDLVRYLLQRWAERGMRILVILALRQDGSCQQQLAEQWLRGLDYGTVTTWLSLERLSDVEVVYLLTALAGGTPEGEQPALRREQLTAFGQWLADTCRGVPSLVIHMLQALLEEGVLRLSPVAGDDWALDVSKTVHAVRTQSGEDLVPGAIRTLIAAQMAHLDETAALLLAAGTVLGDSFSAEQLLQVAAVEERSGEDALDRLVRGKLLREVPETGEYCVDHPLVRDVLYTGLGVARRRRLHRRALAVLQAEGAPAAALERHALAAGLVMQPAQSRMPAATTGAAVPSHLSRDRVTAASARIAPADPAYLHELAPSTIHKFSARYGDLARHTVLSEGHATMHQGSSPRHAPPWDTWPGHFSHQWPWSSVLAPTPRRSAGNAAMGTHHDRSVHGHSVPGQSDGARRSPPSRPPP
jgi:predicted ATPase